MGMTRKLMRRDTDMPVCEVIRRKRKELGLTQEQVAQRLGVSAPAVNKWERGSSYPDIAILPALARLLNTDVNTLLCFQEEPPTMRSQRYVTRQFAAIMEEQGPGDGIWTRRNRRCGSIRTAGN